MLNTGFELNSIYPASMFQFCAQMVNELEWQLILRNIFLDMYLS